MTTVDSEALAADLPAYLERVAGGQVFLIASNRRPVAELRPVPKENGVPDEQELARRREQGRRLEALRDRITARVGVQPSSVELIREIRDHE